MARDRSLRLGTLVGGIALFTLLGFPLVAYLWETLNRLLSGEVEGVRLLVTLPVLLLFLALLRWQARAVRRWEGERAAERHPPTRHPSHP